MLLRHALHPWEIGNKNFKHTSVFGHLINNMLPCYKSKRIPKVKVSLMSCFFVLCNGASVFKDINKLRNISFATLNPEETNKSGNPTSLWCWKPLCRLQLIPFLHFLWKLIRHATWNIDKCIAITHFDKYLDKLEEVWITYAPTWC